MHAITEPLPDAPLGIRLALGLTFTATDDLIDSYDNFIHWYIVPDDRAFLPLRTVFFPKSEDKFGVHGSYGERVGRNQYTPRVTASTIRRFRLMSAGSKIRTFDDGFDSYGFDGTHYHGDQDDFLMRSPRSKYWLHDAAPLPPCPGVPRVRLPLNLAMKLNHLTGQAEATFALQLAFQFDDALPIALKLAYQFYVYATYEAAFNFPLKLGMLAKAHVKPFGVDEFRWKMAFQGKAAEGKDIAFKFPLKLGMLAKAHVKPFGVEEVRWQMGFEVGLAVGKDIAFMHPLRLGTLVKAHVKPFGVEEVRLQMGFVVASTQGKDIPFTHPLELGTLVRSHVKPVGVDEFRLQMGFVVASTQGKDIALLMPLQFAANVESAIGREFTIPIPLEVAAVVTSAIGKDAALWMPLQLAAQVASVVAPEEPFWIPLALACEVAEVIGPDPPSGGTFGPCSNGPASITWTSSFFGSCLSGLSVTLNYVSGEYHGSFSPCCGAHALTIRIYMVGADCRIDLTCDTNTVTNTNATVNCTPFGISGNFSGNLTPCDSFVFGSWSAS